MAEKSKIDNHELVVACKDGNEQVVSGILKKGLLQPSSEKCIRALVVACQGNKIECIKQLLTFGVPGNTSQDGIFALHIVAEAGFDKAARLLLAHKADFEQKSLEGFNAMNMAVMAKPPRLNVVKELLRVNAQIGPNDKASGISACVKEVEMEKLTEELRTYLDIKVTAADISAVDGEVWKHQRTHMRLLVEREEQKAGSLLVDLEGRLSEEQAQARELQGAEEQLAFDLNEKRVRNQSISSELNQILRDLEDVLQKQVEMKAENEKVTAELNAERKLVKGALKEKEESDKARIAGEEARDEAQAITKKLEEELVEARKENETIMSQLRAARAELKGWMDDKEAAAKLTTQAHRILATN